MGASEWKFGYKGWKITCDKQKPSAGCARLETVKIRRTSALTNTLLNYIYTNDAQDYVWLKIQFSEDFDCLEY